MFPLAAQRLKCGVWFLMLVALLGHADAQLSRQAATALNLPSDLPAASGYVTENALGTLTFNSPIKVASLPGITNRLFVVTRNTGIQIVNLDTMTKTTFLDMAGYLTAQGTPLSTDGECGLLSMAFHPNYNQNGYFFVFYSVTIGGQLFERVARFQANGTAGNYNAATTAKTSTHLPLITQLDQATNHNGSDLAFGPDGYLYVSLGDEGNQNDDFDNGRRIARDFFAAILRIDVDLNAANLVPNAHAQNSTSVPSAVNLGTYKVPADNPFVNLPVDGSGNSTYNGYTFPHNTIRTEIWATGFRNPFRMNFDALSGQLFVGDVGQDTYEEVDIVTSGFNGGWSWREGLHTHTPANPPTAEPPGYAPNPPIYEYTHGTGTFQGNAVIGGVVYRGTKFSDLYGAYIFSDNGTSNIWKLTPATPTWTCTALATDSGVVAFGTDPRNGDALICSFGNSQVRRLAASGTTGTAPPALLSQTGVFANLATLTPNAGVVPYEPNVSFWSDYAVKSRWFAIKNATDTVGFSADGKWTLPTGMVWIKHFDFDTTRGDPATRRRLETRILVKTTTDVYGLSYQWRADQSDADLVAVDGLDAPIANSSPAQTWHFPSRNECRICHTPVAGFALSFNTRQMNHPYAYGAQTLNQIAALSSAGYFTAPVAGLNALPAFALASDTTQSLEWRVRSYLAVNCVQCHQPGGAAVGNWDARATTPTDAAQLINGALVNNGGDSATRWAVPGDLTHSMVLKRQQGNGVSRMPPLATTERDLVDEQLISDWITQDLPSRLSLAGWQTQFFGSPGNANAAPTADPDGDGQSNALEFLLGTSPIVPGPHWSVTGNAGSSIFQLTFNQPANRSCLVETTTDFQTWSLWDVPGNAPFYPRITTQRTLAGPFDSTQRFFRLRLSEP